jgi:hypothetical protein
MKYTKPQVALLGKAARVIQGKKNTLFLENLTTRTREPSPAYDLDEEGLLIVSRELSDDPLTGEGPPIVCTVRPLPGRDLRNPGARI